MCPEETQNNNSEITRRSWLDMAIVIGSGIWGLGIAGPLITYLWPAGSTGPYETSVKVGPRDSIAIGEAKLVQVRGKPILVIRRSEERFTAFSAICTHLGCIVTWDSVQKLITCPCHAAVFSADGKVISGPPPGPLPEYQVMEVGGEIIVKVA